MHAASFLIGLATGVLCTVCIMAPASLIDVGPLK